MGELTTGTHKTLLPVGDRPILSWMLQALKNNGINRILFTCGYQRGLLEKWVAEHFPELEVSWIENPDFSSTNTGYSVWLTREHALADDEDLLLINGDVVLDRRAIAATLNAQGQNVLATRFDRVAAEEVKVRLDGNGVVTEIGKHIDPSDAAGESVGINRLSRPLLDLLFPTLEHRIRYGEGRREFYEHAFNELVNRGESFRTADVTELPVIEIDTPEDYATARRHFASRLVE
ncbi:MAG: NTP transferase domain-containing protein [bacterium]